MGVRFAVITACLAGCATLSGLDDKSADLEDGVGAPNRPSDDDDASTSSSGGPTPTADGSSTVDAKTPPDKDGSITPIDAPAGGTRIRNITFENGVLVHPITGFDSNVGGQIFSANPIAGSYSMLADGTAAFGTVSFAPVADLYLTMRFRVDPASPATTGDARILRITHAGGSDVEGILAASPRDFSIVQGGKKIGSVNNLATDGTIHRLELRIQSSGKINFVVTNGSSTVSAGGAGAIGAASKVEVGSISGGTTRVSFDDILIDSAMQP